MKDATIEFTKSYLKELAKGKGPKEFEALTLKGLELVHVGKGILRCKLLITDRVTGEDENWHTGVITTVIDSIGSSAVYTIGEGLYSSVALNASFYSTARIQEKVEIEARVYGTNGKLKSVLTEVRRERDGVIIATGRVWMAPLGYKLKPNASSNLSKL